MKTEQNIAASQEKFIVPVPPRVASIVNKQDRKILAESYLNLYSGFSWVNWSYGRSLGAAWQSAFNQCDSFIKNKKSNNPAQQYLQNVFTSHKKYWSRIIMTYHNSENKMSGTTERMRQFRTHGMRLIRESMDKINLILARYNEHTEELYSENMINQDIASGQYAFDDNNRRAQSQNLESAATHYRTTNIPDSSQESFSKPVSDATKNVKAQSMEQAEKSNDINITHLKNNQQNVAPQQQSAVHLKMSRAQLSGMVQQKKPTTRHVANTSDLQKNYGNNIRRLMFYKFNQRIA